MSDDVSKLSDFFFFDPATRFILHLPAGSGTKWTLHLAVNVRFLIQGSARGLVACSAGLMPFFYFLNLAPRDYVTYCQARGLAMGVWPPRHGPHHRRWPSPQDQGVHGAT